METRQKFALLAEILSRVCLKLQNSALFVTNSQKLQNPLKFTACTQRLGRMLTRLRHHIKSIADYLFVSSQPCQGAHAVTLYRRPKIKEVEQPSRSHSLKGEIRTPRLRVLQCSLSLYRGRVFLFGWFWFFSLSPSKKDEDSVAKGEK